MSGQQWLSHSVSREPRSPHHEQDDTQGADLQVHRQRDTAEIRGNKAETDEAAEGRPHHREESGGARTGPPPVAKGPATASRLAPDRVARVCCPLRRGYQSPCCGGHGRSAALPVRLDVKLDKQMINSSSSSKTGAKVDLLMNSTGTLRWPRGEEKIRPTPHTKHENKLQ